MSSSVSSGDWYDCYDNSSLELSDNVAAGIATTESDSDDESSNNGKLLPCLGRGLPATRLCEVVMPRLPFHNMQASSTLTTLYFTWHIDF